MSACAFHGTELMQFSSFSPYLMFAIGCLLMYGAWIRYVLPLCRRGSAPQQASPQGSPWRMDSRQRHALETRAIDNMRQRCDHNRDEGRQFLDTCLQSMPPGISAAYFHQRSDLHLIERLLVVTVRQLNDDQLRNFVDLLGEPSVNPPTITRKDADRSPSRPSRLGPQQLGVRTGLALSLLMLLVPPWVVQKNHHTRVIGGRHTVQRLDQSAVGYHWIGDRHIPASHITYGTTTQIRRLEHDEQVWHVNYARLVLQFAALFLATGAAAYVSKRHPRQPSCRANTDRQLACALRPTRANGHPFASRMAAFHGCESGNRLARRFGIRGVSVDLRRTRRTWTKMRSFNNALDADELR